MATTLKQLRDQIRLDARIKNKTQYPDLRLTNDINLAQRQLQLKIRELWRNQSSLAATSTTLPAITFGDVSLKAVAFSDITGLLKAPGSIAFIGTTDGANTGIAYEVDRFEFQERANNTYGSSVTNPCFTIQGETAEGTSIWLVPATITTATVYYEKLITDLSADGDILEIPDDYMKQLKDMVIQKIVGMQEEQDKVIQETKTRGQAVSQQDTTIAQGSVQLT